MEIFRRAKVVRLRSHHDKYLLAENDQEGVCQERIGSFKNAKWSVELVDDANLIRLKSCYGKYLTASNMPFLLGATGKKVFQTLPTRLNSSLEWEPIREGNHVRLKTRYGQYLRANGGLPPWRNSITHDIPHRTKTTNWVLWDVDLVELRPQPPPPSEEIQEHGVPTPTLNVCTNDSASLDRPRPRSPSPSPPHSPTLSDNYGIDLMSPIPHKCKDSEESGSPMKKGRMIFYNIGDENGDVPNGSEEKSFTFKGSSVIELKEKLKDEIDHDGNFLVCCRNPLTAKLYPLRLQLPPNNTDMHIIVIPSSSQA